MLRYCLPLLLAVLASAMASEAKAQRRIPNRVRTPVISPYVNLFRGNTGGINSYFTFVRPIQRQLEFNELQVSRNQRLESQILYNRQTLPMQFIQAQNQALQQGLLRPGTPTIGQPAVAASYFNYSHFYGTPVTGGGGGGPRVP